MQMLGSHKVRIVFDNLPILSLCIKVDAAEVYSNLASAAESGWDFSSRWFGRQGTLSSIRTKQIVPVDLNSVMCLNERLLADFYERAGMKTISMHRICHPIRQILLVFLSFCCFLQLRLSH